MASETTSPSLFERIGGNRTIAAAVELFYDNVLADALLRPFFVGLDMQTQKRKQRAFLAYALGAPVRFNGHDLRTAHAPLLARGLTDEHVRAMVGHLATTLAALSVPPAEIAEVLAIAAAAGEDVLGR